MHTIYKIYDKNGINAEVISIPNKIFDKFIEGYGEKYFIKDHNDFKKFIKRLIEELADRKIKLEDILKSL